MSLSTDLSGVNAAQTDIDTVGNNIANVNTTGFKTSDAQFSALYGSALPTAPGQGVLTVGAGLYARHRQPDRKAA
jgi:flagellar hook protein FlgE